MTAIGLDWNITVQAGSGQEGRQLFYQTHHHCGTFCILERVMVQRVVVNVWGTVETIDCLTFPVNSEDRVCVREILSRWLGWIITNSSQSRIIISIHIYNRLNNNMTFTLLEIDVKYNFLVIDEDVMIAPIESLIHDQIDCSLLISYQNPWQ